MRRPMRPERSTVVLLALLLTNACAILFFRFFITVDGPVHALHASLLTGPWPATEHVAQGIVYDPASLHGWLGNRILGLLLLFLSPLGAHDVFAVLVCCAVVLAAVAYLRAHGTRIGLSALWLVPLTFNLLLIMGMFHFLLGVAVAFGTVAWWSGHAGSPRIRLAGLLAGAALAWSTHRGSLILLAILFLLTLLFGPRAVLTPETISARPSRKWRIALVVGLVAVGLAGAWRLAPLMRWVIGAPDGLTSFTPTDLLRPLFLLEKPKESWPASMIGLFLLVSLCAGLLARWRMGRKRHWHDALLLLFFFLSVLSGMYGTHAGHKAFIAERCQFLGLLALILWLAAIADARKGRLRHVIGAATLCALPLHIVRLVRLEAQMAPLRETCVGAMDATTALAPGGLIIPWVIDPHPLLQHVEAYVALGHDGILVSPDEHIRLVLPRKLVWRYWLRTEDRAWLMRQWRKGVPKEVDQILIIGKDIDQAVERTPWPKLLTDKFRSTFDNGHARIYTALRTGGYSEQGDVWGTFVK